VVVIRAAGRRIALAVDELLEVQEVVIKGLGEFLAGLSYFAGATVSAEGEVILVLNPLAVAQAEKTPAITSRALGEGWIEGVPRRKAAAEQSHRIWASVLLVDDSISARKVLGGQLGRAGLAVTTAVDGQEALERLRERIFDAIVTDLEMPRINGYELIEEVRRRPATRDLPILVITTRAGSKHQEFARQLGVDAYFTKPVDEAQLIARLRAAVGPPGEGRTIESPVGRES